MAKATQINIYPERPHSIVASIQWALVFAVPVVAIGVSRAWFGGSWAIDLMAVSMFLLMVVAGCMRITGAAVTLSTAETIAWVAAGAPPDVKAWKADHHG